MRMLGKRMLEKRMWAMALALSMILSLFTGISAKAETQGFFIFETRWDDATSSQVIGNEVDQNDFGMCVHQEEIYYLCTDRENYNDTAITDKSKIKIVDAETDIELNNGDYGISYYPNDNKPAKGFYNIWVNEVGDYEIVYGDYKIPFGVGISDVGIYNPDEEDGKFVFDQYHFISPNSVGYDITDNTLYYYIHIKSHDDEGWIKSSELIINDIYYDYYGNDMDYSDQVSLEKVDDYTYKISFPEKNHKRFWVNYECTMTPDEGDSRGYEGVLEFNPEIFDRNGIGITWSESYQYDKDNDKWIYWAEAKDNWYTKLFSDINVLDELYVTLVDIKSGDNDEDEVVNYITDIDKLSITDYAGNAVSDKASIISYKWNGEEAEYIGDEPYRTIDGCYVLKFNAPGTYKLKYTNGDESSYVVITVNQPEVGLYSESGELLARPWDEYYYTPGETVYISLSEEMKQIITSYEKLESATISFKDEFGIEPVDWMVEKFDPLEVRIPASLSGDLGDSIWVNIRYMVESRDKDDNIIYDENEEPVMVEDERGWNFRLIGDDTGIVVARTYGDWNNCTPENPTNKQQFSKWWSCGAFDEQYLTLGLRKADDSVVLLDENALDNLSVIDEDGNVLNPNDYVLEMATKEDETQYENIFKLGFKKLGRFGIVYNDNDNESKSMFTFGTNIPEISVYGKNVKSGEYLLGSNVEYSSNRRKFYILADEWDDLDNDRKEGSRREITFKSAVAEPESYYVGLDKDQNEIWKPFDIDTDSIELIVDKNNGIIVSIPEKDDAGKDITGNFRVKVFFNRVDENYNEKGEYENNTDRSQQRDFIFTSTDGELSYSDEAEKDIEKADAIIAMIEALPEPGEITRDDTDKVTEAREEFDELTKAQAALVENIDKLIADEQALDDLANEAVADAKALYTANKNTYESDKKALDDNKYKAAVDVQKVSEKFEGFENAKKTLDDLADDSTNEDKYEAAYAMTAADTALAEALETAKNNADKAETVAEVAGETKEAQDAAVAALTALEENEYATDEDKAAITAAQEALNTAKAAVDNLPADATTAQKNTAVKAVDKAIAELNEAVDKAQANAAAAKTADETAKKVEADKQAAVEVAKKEAADAATKAAESKAKQDAEEAAKKAEEAKNTAVEAAKKEAADAAQAAKIADLPKAGDEIYDKTSKAVYVVVKASDGTTEGTVEYEAASKKSKKVTIPESITVNGIKYSVVSIGASAFEGDTTITTVTIPSSVTSIKNKAFMNCSKLKTINLYANNITTIASNAFKSIKKKAKFTIYIADKNSYKKVQKLIKKSKPKSAKYKFSKSSK